jgi:stage II sporulation protein AA (anti-sigma F factor antagonist)
MIEHKLFKDSLYIKITGELDQSAAPALREKIDALIQTLAFEKLILDMSGLQFMDSAGVGLLMGRYRLIKNKRRSLLIRAPSKPVDKVLTVSGIYSIIPKIQ